MKTSLKRLTGVWFALLSFVLALLLFESPLLHVTIGSDIFRKLERTAQDVVLRARGTREWTNRIMMVRIDDFTDSNLGWPIPRDQYGAVMTLLSNSGALAVGLDVPLPPRERGDSTEEVRMIQYLANAQGIIQVIGPFIPSLTPSNRVDPREVDNSLDSVIGQFGIPAPRGHRFPKAPYLNDYPFPELAYASTGVGHISLIPDTLDGVIRSAPLFIDYAGKLYPTLGLALAIQEQGWTAKDFRFEMTEDGMIIRVGTLEIPTGDVGEININYVGTPDVFPSVSFYDILLAARDRNAAFFEQFRDKVCIIGPTVRSLSDFYATPVSESTPGFITHANIYDMIASGHFAQHAPRALTILVLLALTILVGAVAHQSSMRLGVVALISTLILYLIVAYFAFSEAGMILPVVEAIFSLSFAFVTTVSYRAATEGRQKRMITDMFGKYVDSTVVRMMVDNPNLFKLGGEKKEITLLFTDLKGFSGISEKMEDEVLVKLLNTYFTEMTKVITSTRGTVDKYIGDAIMAFWGAPVADQDAPLHACLAALEMQRRLAKINPKIKQIAGVELKQRVGVNTGICTVGNMGSITKVNYTAIGDPVNLASRLEGVNKQYGTAILISEMTHQKVAGKVLTREVDRVVVAGKSEPVRIFELLDVAERSVPEKTKMFLGVYQDGLKAYTERRWDEGIAYMEHAMTYWPEDPVCNLYIERMRLYQIHPPKPEWNGVFVLESK
ncbi:MAG: adenylate/guanylate cyclase domain-containing protein [Bacteroidetes bacterium]|jgi:adenylate cyclase|nr:adenylate/guanylate cyclase domain-containing protein [Bacteroidota bacterium]